MKYALAIVAAFVASTQGSPFPQGVTQAISPPAAIPTGCSPNYSGTFGIAVMNITASGQAPVTQLPDGQPGASTATSAVSTISDGQPQAPTGAPPVSTIADGQPQAPTGVPAVSTIADGQPQAPTGTVTEAPVGQISDGQIQNPTMTMAPINQIGDGQIQQQVPTATPVRTISDGQPQNPVPTATPVNTLSDGQPQNPVPTATPINTLSDGQPQNPAPTATPINTISDGQPQNPTGAVGTMSDGQPTASAGSPSTSGSSMSYVACKQSDSLQVTLANGVLTDNQNRIGYIASNYQFQFDGPPQAGALYTAGFSVCSNGSLALGGSSIFYQCLSGNFYNLYDRNWAPQCNPVNIQVVQLIDC